MEYTVSKKTWCEISAAKLRSNFAALSSNVSIATKKMAVVKSNAYGHGIIECSKILQDAGCDWFGVDDIDEALLLRKNNITRPILVLGATLPYYFEIAKKQNITLTLSTFDAIAECARTGVQVHVKVDTGLGRQGFTNETFLELLHHPQFSNLDIVGIYSHLAAAELESEDEYTNSQLESLLQFKSNLEIKLDKKIMHHVAASAGSILHSQLACDMVRFGISLYGLWPSSDTSCRSHLLLQPILTWKSIITEVKKLPKGHTIGYDRTHILQNDSVVAVVPVGYWHGVSRAQSNTGFVVIHNKKAPILGRVSMDMIVVDITDILNVQYLDEVILIGDQVLAEEFAKNAHTINYEALTCINPLIERIIVS